MDRDVKRAAARRADPFNPKIYRVRAVIFLARKNPSFLARGPLRLARAGPRLIGWPVIFLLVVKNTFNFNANHDFLKKFFNYFHFFLSLY